MILAMLRPESWARHALLLELVMVRAHAPDDRAVDRID